MSSTQRSRAIAALISLVALLAMVAVVGNVLSDPGSDDEGSGVNLLTPAGAADLQVNAADLRAPGSSAKVTAWRLAAPKYRAGALRGGRPRPVTTTMTPPATEASNGSPTLPPSAPTTKATTPTTAKAATTGSVAASSMVTTPSSASTVTQKPPPTVMPPSSAPTTAPATVVTVPSTTPTTAKPTTTTAAATSSSTTAATQPPPAAGGMTGVELEIARMTNELRTNPNGPLARKKAPPSCVQVDGNGKVVAVPALTVSEAVSVNLSRPWSVDMNSRNTMDHRSSASALAIYKQLGISPSTYGENVAWFQGYSDAQAAQVFFEGWRESDGHYCNMMSAGYTTFGVGVYKGATRSWATQNFYATR